MIHDIINILLVVILAISIYRCKSFSKNNVLDKTVEHMDMSMFADNNTTNQAIIKQRLESLESNLLLDKVMRLFRFLKVRDEKAVFDVLSPPEQRVEAQQYPDVSNPDLRLNIRTRGEPDDYQMVGLLYNKDVNKNYQLFGRRVYPGSYEWEYYVRGRDSGGLDIKFPLNQKQEIMDNSTLNLPIDDNVYQVKIYNFDQPRYNPFMY